MTALADVRARARRERRGGSPATFALLMLSLFTVTPFIAVIVLALTPAGMPTLPTAIPTRLTLDNILRVLRVGEFPEWLMNSVVFAGVSVVVILLTASMAGYALARTRFPGREVLLWSIVATMMVPIEATLIPLFIMISRVGGVDTLWGLIIPTLANSQAVFLIRQFIRELPDELFDAARIDGASAWRSYVQIVLPLIRPILATLGIFVFLWHWNSLLWPLVVGQSDASRTLTVGLATLSTEGESYANLMSAALISVLPCVLIFLVLQRYIVNSIVSSGIKG